MIWLDLSADVEVEGSTLAIRIPMRFQAAQRAQANRAARRQRDRADHRAPAGCFRRITSSLP